MQSLPTIGAMPSSVTDEIAAAAARWVVDEGMEYGPAKHKARKSLRGPGERSAGRAELPANEQVEHQVREYIALFHADTQPQELQALRRIALRWMERLAEFRPYVGGAVWRGTATRLSAVHLALYCDDPKSAEIALLNQGIDFDSGSLTDPRGGEIAVLSLADRGAELDEPVTLHLMVYDHDDLRGALKPDAQGRSWRGDATALRRLLDEEMAG